MFDPVKAFLCFWSSLGTERILAIVGKDVVSDFVVADDRIEFQRELFADFAPVRAKTTQSGADAVIAFDAGTSITLKNMQVRP